MKIASTRMADVNGEYNVFEEINRVILTSAVGGRYVHKRFLAIIDHSANMQSPTITVEQPIHVIIILD